MGTHAGGLLGGTGLEVGLKGPSKRRCEELPAARLTCVWLQSMANRRTDLSVRGLFVEMTTSWFLNPGYQPVGIG